MSTIGRAQGARHLLVRDGRYRAPAQGRGAYSTRGSRAGRELTARQGVRVGRAPCVSQFCERKVTPARGLISFSLPPSSHASVWWGGVTRPGAYPGLRVLFGARAFEADGARFTHFLQSGLPAAAALRTHWELSLIHI